MSRNIHILALCLIDHISKEELIRTRRLLTFDTDYPGDMIYTMLRRGDEIKVTNLKETDYHSESASVFLPDGEIHLNRDAEGKLYIRQA